MDQRVPVAVKLDTSLFGGTGVSYGLLIHEENDSNWP